MNAAQWRAIKQHVVMSYRLLSGVEFLDHAAAVAYAHHERLDGSGYPRGLRGDTIPFGARVFAVADAYDVRPAVPAGHAAGGGAGGDGALRGLAL